MGKGIAIFFSDTVTVETYLGKNGRGQDVFAAPQKVKGFSEGNQRTVQDSQGNEVMAEVMIYTYTSYASLFKPYSRVSVNDDTNTTGRVIVAKTHSGPGALRLPDHLSVAIGFNGG